jgi:enolase
MFPSGGYERSLSILGMVSRKLVGFSYDSQEELDAFIDEIDGTGYYERIGGALSLGISMAGAELASKEMDIPLYHWLSNGHVSNLPVPLGNILGGGKHAHGRSIDIQEILVFPRECGSYREAYSTLVDVHREVGLLLSSKDKCFSGGKNDEGAWTTSLGDEEALTSSGRPLIGSVIGVVLSCLWVWM